MIKATIEYADGTKEHVKKRSYIEMAAYYEKERERGAIGFQAENEAGEKIESRVRDGRTILSQVKDGDEG